MSKNIKSIYKVNSKTTMNNEEKTRELTKKLLIEFQEDITI